MRHLIPEFDRMRERFPPGFASSMVLPCLHRIQHERGYVSDEDIEELTQYLGVPKIQVEEVLSFYTMFRRRPIGRHHLQMCHNIACSMRGAESLLSYVERRLGIRPGETTPDGRFTLSTAECLGSCGTAPMMRVDETYHEDLTPAKLDELLDGLE